MHLISRMQRGGTKRAVAFVLCVCLFAFAICLKVLPQINNSSSGNPPQVRIWADPNSSFDTQTKLAPLAFIFILVVLLTFLGRSDEGFGQENPSPAEPSGQFLLGSRHWFRPPPAV